MVTVDLFSIYLLSRVDIVIRYIEVDFTFGLPDYVRYIEEFVISRFVISRFHSMHFTITLAGTLIRYIEVDSTFGLPDYVRYIEDFVKWRFHLTEEVPLYLFGHPRGTRVFSKLQGLQHYLPENLRYNLTYYDSENFSDFIFLNPKILGFLFFYEKCEM